MDKQVIDSLWMMVCISLVFLMQAGFLCLEAGLTRSKNSINVAIKNLGDIGVSVIVFWFTGYALMYGASANGWVGTTHFMPDLTMESQSFTVFLLYQAMFCGTVVTITSGAVAERMRFSSYIVMTLLISGLIFPIFGHWVWNGINSIALSGWLGKRHFVDFAGGTTVHSIGGWVALAALLVIGSREGRFSKNGQPVDISGSNLPLAMVGVLLLAKGWLGFNGGGFREFNEYVPKLLANTVLAGTAGLVGSLIVGLIIKGRGEIRWAMNGTLAGLVSITAGCHVVSTRSAVLIGAFGAVTMLVIEYVLLRFKIDDAVGAIPVHLGAGIWGTLAVALFGNLERLSTGLTRWQQLQSQFLGIGSAFLWAFCVGLIALKVVNHFFPLRVSKEDEYIGLNVSEHNASTEILDLFKAMDLQAKTGDLSLRVPEEPFTEAGQIANHYNRVMNALDEALTRIKSIVYTARDGIITFSKDTFNISTLNPAAEAIFGYHDDALIGRSISEILMPDISFSAQTGDQSVIKLISDNYFSEGYHEAKGKRGDNTIFPMEVAITEARFGEEGYYIGTFHDITDRKLAEEELQQAHRLQKHQHDQLQKQHEKLKETQAQLVQTEKIAGLGTLVAGVAHEINNPNNFVYLSVHSLETELQKFKEFILELAGEDAGEEIKETFEKKFSRLFAHLSDIQDGSTRIKTIVDDLRVCSRQDEEGMAYLDVIEGLKSTIRLIKIQYGKQVDFVCEFGKKQVILCYPNQLNQVFMNIMTNACQAIIVKDRSGNAKNGKILTISTLLEDNHFVIRFQDSGCGMSNKVKEKVFDPFFTTKPVGEGTGLGMSIAHKIVEKHQGRIVVHSIPGKGTKVTVFLLIDGPDEERNRALTRFCET